MEGKMDGLKLESQICFPLYACSKEIIRLYKPYLDPMDLTYTQYIAMLALWETHPLTVKQLGERLYLDSGTLTPVLKKLEAKGFVTRERDKEDERNLIVQVTKLGEKLKAQAAAIPQQVEKNMKISAQENKQLYQLLYKILESVREENA